MNEENVMIQEFTNPVIDMQKRTLYSEYLEREVVIDVYLPAKT